MTREHVREVAVMRPDCYAAPSRSRSWCAGARTRVRGPRGEPLGDWLARLHNGPPAQRPPRATRPLDDVADPVGQGAEGLRDHGRRARRPDHLAGRPALAGRAGRGVRLTVDRPRRPGRQTGRHPGRRHPRTRGATRDALANRPRYRAVRPDRERGRAPEHHAAADRLRELRLAGGARGDRLGPDEQVLRGLSGQALLRRQRVHRRDRGSGPRAGQGAVRGRVTPTCSPTRAPTPTWPCTWPCSSRATP